MGIGYCFGCMESIMTYPCPKCGYVPTYCIAPYTLQPGTILNRKYLIGRVLGQGGFGITYIGIDLQLQRKVAVKEYYPSGFVFRKAGSSHISWYTGDAAQEARASGQTLFLKEARKMSKLGGIDLVPQVYDVFQENETAYICMEFVEGYTLLELLKRTGPLSWKKAKAMFLPLIKTMEQVHNCGLIHRDLSPDNLMIQPDGNVKILDLGSAKNLGLNSGKSSVQIAKNGFSPLEQYAHNGNSGSWTDVYAMAATMYYTMTGILPPSAVDRIGRDTLRWDLPQPQILPVSVCNALKRAMAVRSGERTQSMERFHQELLGTVKTDKKPKEPKKLKKWGLPVAAAAIVLAVVGYMAGSSSGTAKIPVREQGEVILMNQGGLEKTINALQKQCVKESYSYLNGACMDLYFDNHDNECLRIFTNPEGKEDFVFLAEYDSERNILNQYGFEDRKLVRYITWVRNAAGDATEILEYQNDVLVEKSEITYDDQNREISRKKVDGNGRILLLAESTYDAEDREIYSGVDVSGEYFRKTYTKAGNILESINLDTSGKQISRQVYRYDSNGNRTEYLSYDENGRVTSHSEYHYRGDLQTGYTSNVSYSENEYVFEYEYIFGPRNIQFGQIRDSENKTEYVQDMLDSWFIYSYEYSSESDEVYQIRYYEWDNRCAGYDGFDKDGNLISKTEYQYDDKGVQILSHHMKYKEDGTPINSVEYWYNGNGEYVGSISVEYNEDGSYTKSQLDSSYCTILEQTYDSSGNLSK